MPGAVLVRIATGGSNVKESNLWVDKWVDKPTCGLITCFASQLGFNLWSKLNLGAEMAGLAEKISKFSVRTDCWRM